MNFERMRALFLDQAIRGELVPQLAEEGVAEQFGVSPEKKPFVIPNSWKWIQLKHLVSVVSGTSYKKSDQVSEGGVRIIRGGNLRNFKIELRSDDVFVACSLEDPVREIQKEDIVIVASTGSKEVIGRAAVYAGEERVQIGAFLRIVRPKFVSYSDYLKVIFQSDYYRNHIRSSAKGTNINNVKKEYITELYVPIPPIEEQTRIVTKLEETFAEIDRAEKAYEELQTLAGVLRGQILQEAIQGKLVPQLTEEGVVEQIGAAPKSVPFEIPESWKWVPLSSLGKTHTGTTPSTSTKEYFGNDIPFVKPGDIDCCLITYREDGLSSVAREVARLVPEDSLLMVCIGGSIGKVAVCDREVSFNQQINAIVCDEKFSLSAYLFVVMRSPYFQDVVRRNATGTATPIINKSRWGKILIPLPPVEEQDRIVSKVEELLKQVDVLSTR